MAELEAGDVTSNPLNSVVRFLRKVVNSPKEKNESDGELLGRFIALREQTAFETLVQRHGPMVMGVCRRILVDANDADDAFQATFLVLIRRAESIRKRQSLASWLYGVAQRTALRARANVGRRRTLERRVTMQPTTVNPEETWEELRPILDEELQRLPKKYRDPVILCYLEGKTYDEAAAQLACPKGTLSTRLNVARERLRKRFLRRGVSLSAGLIGTLLANQAAPAAVSVGTVSKTVQAATWVVAGQALVTAGVSIKVIALTEGVLHAMFWSKVKVATALLSALLILSGGVSVVGYHAWAVKQEPATISPNPGEIRAEAQPQKDSTRLDRYGDPLPKGAVVRIGSIRFRHTGGVNGVAFTPDGKWLASASDDGTVRLWDQVKGNEIHRFQGPKEGFMSMAFSPDGNILAAGGQDKAIWLWDTRSTEVIHRLVGHRGGIRAVAFSPDGKTLASGCGGQHFSTEDRTIRLWDVASGKEVRQLVGHPRGVRCLAFSLDGKWLASAGGFWENEMRANQVPDDKVRLWDATTGQQVRTLGGHEQGVRAVAFSPDSLLLASGDRKGIRLWNVLTGKEVRRLSTDSDQIVQSIAFSRDGRLLISGGLDGKIRLWDPITGTLVGDLGSSQIGISCVAFSPTGKWAASGGSEKRMHLWDTTTGKELPNVQEHHDLVTKVAFSPDGKFLATSSVDMTIRLWDSATGREIRQFRGHEHYVDTVVFSPDGKRLASTGYMDKSVRLWDVSTGKQLFKLPQPNEIGRFFSVAFSPDGKILAAGGEQGNIHFWQVETGRELPSVGENIPGWVRSVAFSPDGKSIAEVNGESVRRWQLTPVKELPSLTRSEGGLCSLAFSPDGRTMVTGSEEGVLHLWELTSVKERWASPGHDRGLLPVAFSPDGKTIASGGRDATVRLWSVTEGKELHRFKGHTAPIGDVAFSPDGKRVASACEDNTALIWDVPEVIVARQEAGGQPSPLDLEALWGNLSDTDARKAYQAIKEMESSPRAAVEFLTQKIRPIPVHPDEATKKKIAAWIVDLDSNAFETRQNAEQELGRMGRVAKSSLVEALAGNPSLEARKRLQTLVDRFNQNSPEDLRFSRAVEVLEHIHTPEARRALRKLAAGAPDDPSTQEAKDALERMAK